ncbi:hypothetical protein [Halopenitus sp. POP-27]|uniref:hypothetical protein n=1 Tax=Halopenitus sp. POP-27 TaxID=2994425 RepID=UPI0024696B70|nr:hypothetical protein [Halopenitus sp. POP-27]
MVGVAGVDAAPAASGTSGPALPTRYRVELDHLEGPLQLCERSRIRIAEEGEMYPNFETWFVSNDVEREALSNPLTVTFDEGQIEISPIELQIAYKLRLAQAADSLSGKDFEDALHLYLTFEERFNTEQLETYVNELGVEDYYAELKRV